MLKIFSTAEHLESRLWEIDFLRGVAIIMMIISNFITDLDYFNISDINSLSGFWWFFSRTTAVIFIFLVGVSLTLSYSRSEEAVFRLKSLKRGMKIFSWGLIITPVSWIFLRQNLILFGVLHLIGISIILSYPLLKFRLVNLFLGALLIAIWTYSQNFWVNSIWLLWLIPITNYFSVDYLPLIPWFSAVLIGIFIGNLLYARGVRTFKVPRLEKLFLTKFLTFLGRNSLLIYLIHQPILILLLKILGTQGVVA